MIGFDEDGSCGFEFFLSSDQLPSAICTVTGKCVLINAVF